MAYGFLCRHLQLSVTAKRRVNLIERLHRWGVGRLIGFRKIFLKKKCLNVYNNKAVAKFIFFLTLTYLIQCLPAQYSSFIEIDALQPSHGKGVVHFVTAVRKQQSIFSTFKKNQAFLRHDSTGEVCSALVAGSGATDFLFHGLAVKKLKFDHLYPIPPPLV